MSSAVDLKTQGNEYFKQSNFSEALLKYSSALTLLDSNWKNPDTEPKPQSDFVPDQINLLSALYKNYAACILKNDSISKDDLILTVTCCKKALFYNGNDIKASYRLAQAHEKMGNIDQAYSVISHSLQIEPKNKLLSNFYHKLRTIYEKQLKNRSSTEKRVENMIEILSLVSCDEKLSNSKNTKQAAENLVVLSREEAGARKILSDFEKNLDLLRNMLISDTVELKISSIRAISYLVRFEKGKYATKILDKISLQTMENSIMSNNDSLSISASNLYQIWLDIFFTDEENQNENSIYDLINSISGVIDVPECSNTGRDYAINLLTSNVPRRSVSETHRRLELIFDNNSFERILNVASWSFDHQKLSEISSKGTVDEPLMITKNTQMNCVVCLAKLYEDCSNDELKKRYEKICLSQFRSLQSSKIINSSSSNKNLTVNLRMLSLLTCLFLGPEEIGLKILLPSIEDEDLGMLEIITAMTAENSTHGKHEISQIVAIETILAAINKTKNVQKILENGTSLLKRIYKDSSLPSVRIRALVGLCKIGSSHGSDVSKKIFDDGSSVKLARQCRKFLTDKLDDEMIKWSIEGLSYLSLDADVKEEIVEDSQCLQQIYQLLEKKPNANCLQENLIYPGIHIFANVANCHNLDDKRNSDQEIEQKKREIAKFAKQPVPEDHEKDGPKFVKTRIQKLIQSGLVTLLTKLVGQQTNKEKLEASNSIFITAGMRELITRLVHKAAEDQSLRGTIVSQGGGKILIDLFRSKENTNLGKLLSAQGVARLAITLDPVLAFPGQRTYEAISILLNLLHDQQDYLMNFEGLMALTNIASINEGHRSKICSTPGMLNAIESLVLEEHEMIRRAGVELICNLSMSPIFCQQIINKEAGDRLKLLVLMCQEEDAKTRSAAAGALAMMTSNDHFAQKISGLIAESTENWIECLAMVCLDYEASVRHRGVVVIQNISKNSQKLAEKLAESTMKEILSGMARDMEISWGEGMINDQKNRDFLKNLCQNVLDLWLDYGLISINHS